MPAGFTVAHRREQHPQHWVRERLRSLERLYILALDDTTVLLAIGLAVLFLGGTALASLAVAAVMLALGTLALGMIQPFTRQNQAPSRPSHMLLRSMPLLVALSIWHVLGIASSKGWSLAGLAVHSPLALATAWVASTGALSLGFAGIEAFVLYAPTLGTVLDATSRCCRPRLGARGLDKVKAQLNGLGAWWFFGNDPRHAETAAFVLCNDGLPAGAQGPSIVPVVTLVAQGFALSSVSTGSLLLSRLFVEWWFDMLADSEALNESASWVEFGVLLVALGVIGGAGYWLKLVAAQELARLGALVQELTPEEPSSAAASNTITTSNDGGDEQSPHSRGGGGAGEGDAAGRRGPAVLRRIQPVTQGIGAGGGHGAALLLSCKTVGSLSGIASAVARAARKPPDNLAAVAMAGIRLVEPLTGGNATTAGLEGIVAVPGVRYPLPALAVDHWVGGDADGEAAARLLSLRVGRLDAVPDREADTAAKTVLELLHSGELRGFEFRRANLACVRRTAEVLHAAGGSGLLRHGFPVDEALWAADDEEVDDPPVRRVRASFLKGPVCEEGIAEGAVTADVDLLGLAHELFAVPPSADPSSQGFWVHAAAICQLLYSKYRAEQLGQAPGQVGVLHEGSGDSTAAAGDSAAVAGDGGGVQLPKGMAVAARRLQAFRQGRMGEPLAGGPESEVPERIPAALLSACLALLHGGSLALVREHGREELGASDCGDEGGDAGAAAGGGNALDSLPASDSPRGRFLAAARCQLRNAKLQAPPVPLDAATRFQVARVAAAVYLEPLAARGKALFNSLNPLRQEPLTPEFPFATVDVVAPSRVLQPVMAQPHEGATEGAEAAACPAAVGLYTDGDVLPTVRSGAGMLPFVTEHGIHARWPALPPGRLSTFAMQCIEQSALGPAFSWATKLPQKLGLAAGQRLASPDQLTSTLLPMALQQVLRTGSIDKNVLKSLASTLTDVYGASPLRGVRSGRANFLRSNGAVATLCQLVESARAVEQLLPVDTASGSHLLVGGPLGAPSRPRDLVSRAERLSDHLESIFNRPEPESSGVLGYYYQLEDQLRAFVSRLRASADLTAAEREALTVDCAFLKAARARILAALVLMLQHSIARLAVAKVQGKLSVSLQLAFAALQLLPLADAVREVQQLLERQQTLTLSPPPPVHEAAASQDLDLAPAFQVDEDRAGDAGDKDLETEALLGLLLRFERGGSTTGLLIHHVIRVFLGMEAYGHPHPWTEEDRAAVAGLPAAPDADELDAEAAAPGGAGTQLGPATPSGAPVAAPAAAELPEPMLTATAGGASAAASAPAGGFYPRPDAQPGVAIADIYTRPGSQADLDPDGGGAFEEEEEEAEDGAEDPTATVEEPPTAAAAAEGSGDPAVNEAAE